jgi:hypothetical protein
MGRFLSLGCGCAAVFLRRVGGPAVVALALTGCASVVGGGPSDRLRVTSSPPGAEVKASTGETCSTPCALLFGGGDFTVVVSKRGFKTERFAVGENCASSVDIALRPITSIIAYELPDRDLPLIANCQRRAGGSTQPTALAPVH